MPSRLQCEISFTSAHLWFTSDAWGSVDHIVWLQQFFSFHFFGVSCHLNIFLKNWSFQVDRLCAPNYCLFQKKHVHEHTCNNIVLFCFRFSWNTLERLYFWQVFHHQVIKVVHLCTSKSGYQNNICLGSLLGSSTTNTLGHRMSAWMSPDLRQNIMVEDEGFAFNLPFRVFFLGFCFGKAGFCQFPVRSRWCTARTPRTALHEPGTAVRKSHKCQP